MAKHTYAAGGPARNRGGTVSTIDRRKIPPLWRGGPLPKPQPFSDAFEAEPVSSHHDISLFERLDAAGVMSLDALVRSVPDHPRPLASILAMIDAGLIMMDGSTAFDGDTQLWCLVTAPRP